MAGRFHGPMARRRIVSLNELEDSLIRPQMNGENIYMCPWCVDERGSRDRRGHLYINVINGVGHCFRCQTSVRVRERDMTEQAKRELDAWLSPQPAEVLGRAKGDQVGIPFSQYEAESRNRGFAYLDVKSSEKVHQYLAKRHVTLIVARQAKLMYNPDLTLLMFPFLNPYDLVSMAGYAERSLGPDAERRWNYSRAGIRNLYFPSAVVAKSPYWVITEGPPCALSLVSRGYPGVGLGGSSLSESQRIQVGLFMPRAIDICFDADATDAVTQLIADLRSIYRAKNVTLEYMQALYSPAAKDPAELTNEQLHKLLGSAGDAPLAITPEQLRWENDGGPTVGTD